MNETICLLVIGCIIFLFYTTLSVIASLKREISDEYKHDENNQLHVPCNNCPWAKNITWEEIHITKFLKINPPDDSKNTAPKPSNIDDDFPF